MNGARATPGEHDAHRGYRAPRQSHRHRPDADRPHAALQSRAPTSRCSTTSATCSRSCRSRKRRGYKPGRFSFNVAGGRCEACDGNGSNKLEMDFLADVWVTCPVCARGTASTARRCRCSLQGQEHRRRAGDGHPGGDGPLRRTCRRCCTSCRRLHAVGLDYLKLGQPSPTLSGGEAQRIKLARELVKKSTGKTLYVLDEPTTGLHFADIETAAQGAAPTSSTPATRCWWSSTTSTSSRPPTG